MAKKDKELFDRLRSLGVKKSSANKAATALKNSGNAAPKAARRLAADLSGAAAEIQDRINKGPQKRKAAAQKAAKTRAKNAKSRSDSAKKAAKTRAKKS